MSLTNQLSSNAILKLTEFSSANKIRQIVYFFIVYRCNHDKDFAKYSSVFSGMDFNKSGYLETEYVKKVLSERIPDEERVRKIVQSMDIDNNGKIYWNEFCSALISREIIFKPENICEAFQLIDIDEKGWFTAQDFCNAVCQIGNLS